MKSKSIILLSAGIDSVVSLAMIKNTCDEILALTFDYGQKSNLQEINNSQKICDYYRINHKVIKLDWLKNIANSAITNDSDIPELKINELDNTKITNESAKSVWIPNRNALFVNIAACFAESLNFNSIVLGANKEESTTFKDNSKEFIDAINYSLKNSTNNEIKLIAPLINMDKTQIIKQAIDLSIPFEFIHSCYKNVEKNCGKCESCLRLKRALYNNNKQDIINQIFEEDKI